MSSILQKQTPYPVRALANIRKRENYNDFQSAFMRKRTAKATYLRVKSVGIPKKAKKAMVKNVPKDPVGKP